MGHGVFVFGFEWCIINIIVLKFSFVFLTVTQFYLFRVLGISVSNHPMDGTPSMSSVGSVWVWHIISHIWLYSIAHMSNNGFAIFIMWFHTFQLIWGKILESNISRHISPVDSNHRCLHLIRIHSNWSTEIGNIHY